MLEAQLDGARLGEIERSKLETVHRLQLERLDREAAHGREMARLAAATKESARSRPWLWAAGSLPVLLAVGALAVFALQAPKKHARESIDRARALAAQHDPASLARAESELAIARAEDPQNPDLAPLQSTIDDEKAELRRAEAAKEARKTQDVAAMQALRDELEAKLAAMQAAKPEAGSTTEPKTPKPKAKLPTGTTKKEGGCTIEVAGVPMCSKK
jgi:hypothetical protein